MTIVDINDINDIVTIATTQKPEYMQLCEVLAYYIASTYNIPIHSIVSHQVIKYVTHHSFTMEIVENILHYVDEMKARYTADVLLCERRNQGQYLTPTRSVPDSKDILNDVFKLHVSNTLE